MFGLMGEITHILSAIEVHIHKANVSFMDQGRRLQRQASGSVRRALEKRTHWYFLGKKANCNSSRFLRHDCHYRYRQEEDVKP
jgi:hypothetical protein